MRECHCAIIGDLAHIRVICKRIWCSIRDQNHDGLTKSAHAHLNAPQLLINKSLPPNGIHLIIQISFYYIYCFNIYNIHRIAQKAEVQTFQKCNIAYNECAT